MKEIHVLKCVFFYLLFFFNYKRVKRSAAHKIVFLPGRWTSDPGWPCRFARRWDGGHRASVLWVHSGAWGHMSVSGEGRGNWDRLRCGQYWTPPEFSIHEHLCGGHSCHCVRSGSVMTQKVFQFSFPVFLFNFGNLHWFQNCSVEPFHFSIWLRPIRDSLYLCDVMCSEIIMELLECKWLSIVTSQVLWVSMNLEHHFRGTDYICSICDFHVCNLGPPGIVVNHSKQVITLRDA